MPRFASMLNHAALKTVSRRWLSRREPHRRPDLGFRPASLDALEARTLLSTVPVVLTSLEVYDSADPSGRSLGPPFSGANPTPAAQAGGDVVCATYTNNDPKSSDPGIRVGLASSGITQATSAQITAAAALGYTLPANWSTAFPGTLPVPGTTGAPPLAVYQFYLDDHVLYDAASALVYPVGSKLGLSSVTICVNLSHSSTMPGCTSYTWDEIDAFYYANSDGSSNPNAANNNGGLINNFSMSDDYGQFAGSAGNPAFYQNADHIFGGAVVNTTAAQPGAPIDVNDYPGFWKKHPEAWPVTDLAIAGKMFTQSQLIAEMQTPPKGGNATVIALYQLITAELNEATGAPITVGVQNAILEINSVLAANGLTISSTGVASPFIKTNTTDGQTLTNDADYLSTNYNFN